MNLQTSQKKLGAPTIPALNHTLDVVLFSAQHAIHSALIRNLIKLKDTAKLTAQGEQACLKDSKYILFEILAHRTWKGRVRR